VGKYADQMTGILIDRERARLIQEASDLADAATLFARNVDSAIACGDAERIAQTAQQLAQHAARVAAMRELVEVYDAEKNLLED
jgi:uridine phosphorylase